MLSSCFFLYIFMWVYIEIVSCTHGYIENRCRGFFFCLLFKYHNKHPIHCWRQQTISYLCIIIIIILKICCDDDVGCCTDFPVNVRAHIPKNTALYITCTFSRGNLVGNEWGEYIFLQIVIL